MAIGDLYEITLYGKYLGEDNNNVFHYRHVSGSTATAEDLDEIFEYNVLEDLQHIVCTGVTWTRVKVMNLTNPLDNWEMIPPTFAAGLAAGVGAPSFVAINFQSRRPDLSKRFSYKRFAGILTSFINGNSYFADTAMAAALDQLAGKLGMVLGNASGSFAPIQVRKQKVAGVWTFTENYQITEYTWDIQLTTQNSRKVGHGD